MHKFRTIAALSIAGALLASCGNAEDNKITQTQMDDIDSVAGTISDDVLNTDESTEEAPVDALAATNGKPDSKKAGKTEETDDKKIDDPADAEEPVTADKGE